MDWVLKAGSYNGTAVVKTGTVVYLAPILVCSLQPVNHLATQETPDRKWPKNDGGNFSRQTKCDPGHRGPCHGACTRHARTRLASSGP